MSQVETINESLEFVTMHPENTGIVIAYHAPNLSEERRNELCHLLSNAFKKLPHMPLVLLVPKGIEFETMTPDELREIGLQRIAE